MPSAFKDSLFIVIASKAKQHCHCEQSEATLFTIVLLSASLFVDYQSRLSLRNTFRLEFLKVTMGIGFRKS
jgi:hypothetical protein